MAKQKVTLMAVKRNQPTQSDFQKIRLDDHMAMQEREDVLLNQLNTFQDYCRDWLDRWQARNSIKGRALQPE